MHASAGLMQKAELGCFVKITNDPSTLSSPFQSLQVTGKLVWVANKASATTPANFVCNASQDSDQFCNFKMEVVV